MGLYVDSLHDRDSDNGESFDNIDRHGQRSGNKPSGNKPSGDGDEVEARSEQDDNRHGTNGNEDSADREEDGTDHDKDDTDHDKDGTDDGKDGTDDEEDHAAGMLNVFRSADAEFLIEESHPDREVDDAPSFRQYRKRDGQVKFPLPASAQNRKRDGRAVGRQDTSHEGHSRNLQGKSTFSACKHSLTFPEDDTGGRHGKSSVGQTRRIGRGSQIEQEGSGRHSRNRQDEGK